jgi:hypothetical protein
MMLTLGLTVALPLWRAARDLHAPPGAGYMRRFAKQDGRYLAS